MLIVAWSIKQSKFDLKNRSLKYTTQALLRGPQNDLKNLQDTMYNYNYKIYFSLNVNCSMINQTEQIWFEKSDQSLRCPHEETLDP